MITKIWLQEYGPFHKAEFSLAPLTVLVGPNASGKTTAMEALRRVQEAIHGADSLYDDQEGCYLNEVVFARVVRDFFQSFGRIQPTARPFVAFEVNSLKLFFSELDESGPALPGSQLVNAENLPPIKFLRFEPGALRSASYLDAGELVIRHDGYGLATVLTDMKLQDDEKLEWIERQVRTIIPSFERVRFRRVQVHRMTESIAGQEIIFDMKNAPGLSPEVVSDGTILVLGIVTGIAATVRSQEEDEPALVLIDDIERGLHPRALSDFVDILRRMTREMSVQILATSHSPYLLDWLKPEEVRITGFLNDGTATVCRLSDHPDFERWRDEMSPGEFWSTVGEDWIRDVKR